MNSSPIGQKIFSPKLKKCGMSESKSKIKDKNRFIQNKKIVEKIKLSKFQKYYLKGNIPRTVDVLRAGK